jgi:hypothetical protein
MSEPRFTLSDQYSRAEHLSLSLEYKPHLGRQIAAVVAARIEGRELEKRRPTVKMYSEFDGHVVCIEPKLESSATGWTLNKIIPVTIWNINDPAIRLKAKLRSDCTLTLKSWARNAPANRKLLGIMDAALLEMAADIRMIFAGSSGICGICHKLLSDETSRSRGIGPECWAPYGRIIRAIESTMESAQ